MVKIRTWGLVLLMAALTSACGAEPPRVPRFVECPGLAQRGQPVFFTDVNDTELAGVVLGNGTTGVVLSHMSDGKACSWGPYADHLVSLGYRVLVYYMQNYGESGSGINSSYAANVVGGAKLLRDQGATSIVLIGASMGGTATIGAAAELSPPPAAVVALSAPRAYSTVDALAAAEKLTVPVLYAVGDGDGSFLEESQLLYDTTPATTERTLKIVDSSLHGVGLEAVIEAEVDAFLAEHAPPRPAS